MINFSFDSLFPFLAAFIDSPIFEMQRIPILRHTKIKAEAHPFDPRFTTYLKEREQGKRVRPDIRPGRSLSEVFNRSA